MEEVQEMRNGEAHAFEEDELCSRTRRMFLGKRCRYECLDQQLFILGSERSSLETCDNERVAAIMVRKWRIRH